MNDQTRTPAGVPTGGQFAASARSESDVSLTPEPPAQDTSLETFEITVHGYFARDEIPPRCRNARRVVHDTSAVVTIPRVAREQAPVAITLTDGIATDDPTGDTEAGEIRTFDGNLYEPYRPASGQRETVVVGSDQFPDIVQPSRFRQPTGSSPEDFAAAQQQHYDRYLVVEERVWCRVDEPRYVVQTFGLGGGHGSTGLFVVGSDNPNIAADAYFRADEFEAARDHAISVAEQRGDTTSAAGLRKTQPKITVHDPSALRLVTVPRESGAVTEAREHFDSVASDYARLRREHPSPAHEAAVWAELVDARQRLLAHTDDVVGEAATRRPYEEGRTDWW